MKLTFFHGMLAGILAGVMAVLYNMVYSKAMLVDFTEVVKPVGIVASSVFGCILASFGYYLVFSRVRKGKDIWFNALFLVLTFASFAGIFSVDLPVNVNQPELFAGLTVPMHLFPVVCWLAVKPFFRKIEQH